MELNQKLLRGIYAYGFEKPSAIQQRAIIPCISGRDVIAQAQSGTGKTATFSIAILQQINPENRFCQALILAPTRELAQQVNIYVNLIFIVIDNLKTWTLQNPVLIGELQVSIISNNQEIESMKLLVAIDAKLNPKPRPMRAPNPWETFRHLRDYMYIYD